MVQKWSKNGAIVLSSAQFYHDSLTRTWFFPSFFVWRGRKGWSQIPFPQNKKTPAKMLMLGHWHRRFVQVKGLPLFLSSTVYLDHRFRTPEARQAPVRFHVVAVMMSSWCDLNVTSQKKNHRIFPTIFSFDQKGGRGNAKHYDNYTLEIQHTLPATNIALENGWLEYQFPSGMTYFQALC